MAERIEDLAASFRRDLRAAGRSPRTIAIYGAGIDGVVDWLTSHDREPVLSELTRSAIRAYLAELGEAGRAPNTIATRFRALRRFCRWLIAEGEITTDPMAGMEHPSVPLAPVPLLSDDELARLIKACQGKDSRSRRDEAIIRLLLDTGMRVSELCGVTVDALDLDAEMVIVRGKGRKVRPTYFSSKTTRALDRWLRARKLHSHADSDALFIAQRGPMTPDGIRVVVANRGRQAGIKDRVHPHRFRHSFAHDFLISGGQERDLKRLAGWSSDQMLSRYAASGADLRAREAARRLRRGDRV